MNLPVTESLRANCKAIHTAQSLIFFLSCFESIKNNSFKGDFSDPSLQQYEDRQVIFQEALEM